MDKLVRVAIAALAFAAAGANAQSLLEDMLTTPSKPISDYTMWSTFALPKRSAEALASLNDPGVMNWARIYWLPSRKEFPPLMDMAEKYVKDDAEARANLAALRAEVHRLDAVAEDPANAEAKAFYDTKMLSKAQGSLIAYAIANNRDPKAIELAHDFARRFDNPVGQEALKVYDVWLRFGFGERGKIGRVAGAREAVLVLSSPTVEAAEWHLERARLKAALNDPYVMMQGVVELNAVVAHQTAVGNPQALDDAAKRQADAYDLMKAVEEDDRVRARVQASPN